MTVLKPFRWFFNPLFAINLFGSSQRTFGTSVRNLLPRKSQAQSGIQTYNLLIMRHALYRCGVPPQPIER